MIKILEAPPAALDMTRRELLLVEPQLGQVDAFRNFFRERFALDALGLSRPAYVLTRGGRWLELIFVGRSGEPFPSGVEIHARVPDLEPLDTAAAETDLAEFMQWMFDGVGPPWSGEAWRETARLYRLPQDLKRGDGDD